MAIILKTSQWKESSGAWTGCSNEVCEAVRESEVPEKCRVYVHLDHVGRQIPFNLSFFILSFTCIQEQRQLEGRCEQGQCQGRQASANHAPLKQPRTPSLLTSTLCPRPTSLILRVIKYSLYGVKGISSWLTDTRLNEKIKRAVTTLPVLPPAMTAGIVWQGTATSSLSALLDQSSSYTYPFTPTHLPPVKIIARANERAHAFRTEFIMEDITWNWPQEQFWEEGAEPVSGCIVPLST